MELDELKTAWAAHGERLERSLAIQERLLHEHAVRSAKQTLAPFALGRALELVLGLVAIVLAAGVLSSHLGDARYLIVGSAVLALAIGFAAQAGYALRLALRFDRTESVTRLRRRVDELELAAFRAFRWALLGGILLWLPVGLVLVEATCGVPALARIELGYLVANLLVGALVLAGGVAWSRRIEHEPESRFARRVLDALSGRSLRRARVHLAELAEFERE